jgi:hypothetical protein
MDKDFFDKMQEIKALLHNKEIPDAYPERISGVSQRPFNNPYYIDRFDFINISSFALVSKRWIGPLAAYIRNHKCLEIMAGKGVVAKGLNGYGVDIKATDNYTWKWHRSRQNKNGRRAARDELWYDVEYLDCVEAINRYGGAVGYIICSWPPYESGDVYRALLTMREVNPECKLIYIGEEAGGCNAEGRFYRAARFIGDDGAFNHVAGLFQRWPTIRDRIMLAE